MRQQPTEVSANRSWLVDVKYHQFYSPSYPLLETGSRRINQGNGKGINQGKGKGRRQLDD